MQMHAHCLLLDGEYYCWWWRTVSNLRMEERRLLCALSTLEWNVYDVTISRARRVCASKLMARPRRQRRP